MALEHFALVHGEAIISGIFMELCDTHCTNMLLLHCWEKIPSVRGFMALCSTALAFLLSSVISIGYKEKVGWNCHFTFCLTQVLRALPCAHAISWLFLNPRFYEYFRTITSNSGYFFRLYIFFGSVYPMNTVYVEQYFVPADLCILEIFTDCCISSLPWL